MKRKLVWNLRAMLALHGIYKTTELVPLLAEHGVALSREQVYRLVTTGPQRLNMEVLDALCQILDCTPNDLITFEALPARSTGRAVNDNSRDASDLTPVRAVISRPHVQGDSGS